jgi:hypothetical protein
VKPEGKITSPFLRQSGAVCQKADGSMSKQIWAVLA